MFLINRKPIVAIVEIHGTIGTKIKDSTYSRVFEGIARNKRYGALVLDIDSPGGSATGSDLLYHSIKRVAESKPVVAYIRGLGASGGYYLGCAANQIVSLPTALIGSIGVIHIRPIIEQLLNRVGVEISVFKEGYLKDMSGFWRSPTDEEKNKFQSLLNEMYETFVKVVADGRNLDRDQVRILATGELYTAQKGYEMGLVDVLADFQRSIEIAAELGAAKPTPKWVRPKKTFSARMLGRESSSMHILSNGINQLTSGGIYYLDPAHMLGDRHSSFLED